MSGVCRRRGNTATSCPTKVVDGESSVVFGRRKTLSQVLAPSTIPMNSIDLLQRLARATADDALEDQMDISVFALNRTVEDVMSEFEKRLVGTEGVQP